MERKTAARLSPLMLQNSVIEYVTRVKGTMRFSRGRRGLGSIWRFSYRPDGQPKSQIAWLSQLEVNPLLNPAGSQAHEVRIGPAGRDGFANLETPFPQARLNLREGEINAPVVHDLRDGDTLFASSSVSNFKITLRVVSSCASARRLLSSARFSRWMYLSMPFSVSFSIYAMSDIRHKAQFSG
jgi:hypothetical protein